MSQKILVVDDNLMTLDLVSRSLSRVGYEVVTSESGREALEILENLEPDLIILDVMMPEMDGYEVCRQLRGKPATAHLPVLMLTALDSLEEKVKGFEAGADDYMTKPFQPAELQARARVLLRRMARATGEITELTGMVIAVFSLRGGVGVSTVAVNLATALAQIWGSPTALMDLSLIAGQSALLLNLSLRHTWADLVEIPGEDIDQELLDDLLLSHPSGVQVLAAPRHPEQSELLTNEKVGQVIEMLSQRYHYVVLDMPHNFRETTLAGLDRADTIVTLIAPELASVLAISTTMEVFDTLDYHPEKIRIALNHILARGALSLEDIEAALKRPIDLVIPYDVDTFVSAINLGVPPVFGATNTRVAGLLEDYAFHLSKDEHRKSRPKNPTDAWKRVTRRMRQHKKN
jgi:pilus assembly protein CpaE